MPSSRLDIAIRLAERRCRHETTPFLERGFPEPAREDLVVAHVSHRPRSPAVLQEHETPAHHDDLALTVGRATYDRRHVPWKNCRCSLKRDRAVVRDAKEPCHGVALFIEGVQIAHGRG